LLKSLLLNCQKKNSKILSLNNKHSKTNMLQLYQNKNRIMVKKVNKNNILCQSKKINILIKVIWVKKKRKEEKNFNKRWNMYIFFKLVN
jgi:hypothetical protein